MADDFKYDVFLSHTSKDKAVVRPLAERLRDDGVRVWFDEWEIRAGDSIPAKIEEGVEQSRVLVLCMSAQAFGSDWSKLESYTFRFRDPLNKERRFIPLRLDEAHIPGSLSQFSYINWLPEEREQEYAKLLEACRPSPKSVAERETTGVKFAEKSIKLHPNSNIDTYAFSPDGSRALTGSRSDTMRLWDVTTRRCLRVFKGHTNEVNSLTWSADQRYALSGSDDKTVRLWDMETGHRARILKGRGSEVRWMEISSVLKRESQNGKKPVKQIEFKGERLDMSSVRRRRDEALKQGLP